MITGLAVTFPPEFRLLILMTTYRAYQQMSNNNLFKQQAQLDPDTPMRIVKPRS